MNVELLRRSFAWICDEEPALTARFYAILFTRYPQVMPLFGRNSSRKQQEMLGKALASVLEHLEHPDWLATALGSLGAKHATYGVTREMYSWVGECLLATLAEIAGDTWTPALEAAWTEAYTAVAGLMIAGTCVERAAATAP